MADAVQWHEEAAPEPYAEPQRFDLAGLLYRQKWMLLLGLAVGLGLGYLYFSRQEPLYESATQMLVTRQGPTSPLREAGGSGTSGGMLGQSLATQRILIRSPLIIERAITNHGLESLPFLEKRHDLVSAIKANLTVAQVDEERAGNVLELSYRSRNPENCSQVVAALVESYQAFLGETQQNISEETAELISEAKDELLKKLEKKEAAYRKFRQDSPLLTQGGETTNIHEQRLANIEEERAKLIMERSQLEAEVQAVESALEQGGSREALMLMVGRSEGKQSGNADTKALRQRSAVAERLFPLLLEEQMLKQTHGPDHPELVALQKRIEFTRSYIRDLAGEESRTDEQQPQPPKDFLSVYLDSLRQELAANRQKEQKLNELFEQEQEAAKSLSNYEIQDETYSKEIARTQQLFDSVVKRLEEISLIKDYGGYSAQVIAPAELGRQVSPNLARIMAIAGVLGLLGSFGLGYVSELADKSFHSPEEIGYKLGVPVVGHIPAFNTRQPRAAEGDLGTDLWAYHRPKSRTSEAYRGVRTALYFSVRGSGHKVIQVTSPNPGDGKTTLAANLAISIAQSGKTALLLDADCRRPRLNKAFHLERDNGLTAVIQALCTIEEAIQPTEIEGLSVITCGPKVPNPSELLTSLRFEELLNELRAEYDFVIVDSPPLLAVTDPSVVAARADGVVQTIRLTKNASVSAMRAQEVLAAVGAKILGTVVNGVGGKGRKGYGYSAYRYGSRYGYGYGYGYGDGDPGQGSYYLDEESGEIPSNGHPSRIAHD